jgi:predicted dehydrogenase
MSYLSRRTFGQGAALAGASFLISGTRASGNIKGANERIRIAVAGLNGRGKAHISGWLSQPNVEIAYLIDPDQTVLERTMRDLEKKTDGKLQCQGISDVRKALEDKTLDAISIATPNHWHSLMTIWGAQAGKHVYVEKPMSHDIREGRIVVEAQKKYGVVIQHGTQRRSQAGIAGLHEAIQSGKFGKLKISYGYACKPRAAIKYEDPAAPPSSLDWKLWRGPAMVDYHPVLVPYEWHWFWKTGNGELNNQGTHQLDVARWAIDKDQTHPIRAMAIGGRFKWNDQGETPNTMFGIAEYPNKQFVFFNIRNVNHEGYKSQVTNEYYFEDGSKITGENKYTRFEKGASDGEPLKLEPGKVTPGGNWGAFVTAIRAGDPLLANGNAEEAHYGCVLGHLINNSYRLGKSVPFSSRAADFGENRDAIEHFNHLHEIMDKQVGIKEGDGNYIVGPWLTFDPKSERHTGDFADEANALLKDPNNPGFEVPELDKL